jgi:glutamate-1-semialdehyde aminotransferase/acyl carrier protein
VTRQDDLIGKVRALAADLSGIAPDDLDAARPFLGLGFDSLLLTQFAATIQKAFGVKTTFRQLMEDASSIAALAAMLDAALPAAAPAPPAAAPSPAPAIAETPPAASATPAPRLAAAANADGLAAVFQAQLALMQQQLEMLTGGATSLPQVAAPASAAATPSPAAPAQKPKFELPKGFGPQVSNAGPQLSAAERAHVERLIARYNAKTRGSKERTQANRAHFADPRTAAGFNRIWKEMVYPIVVERSHGAYLFDVDGNRYVDILNGFGPNFFGHRAPFIVEAIRKQLDSGYEVGPQTPLAGEAAKIFCELTGMDRVSWVNTGSEAVQAAIRLSRTVTGRDKIVVFSGDYHGNFDEVLVRGVTSASGRRAVPLAPGIPFSSVGNVLVLDYGEESALEEIARGADDIAAVLVEPVQSRRPEFRPREFLHKLRTLTQEKGIVLVFDEVITGFRIAPGGAQAYYGVEADLATYGKIIGGGMPIGVVAGRSKFMDTFDGGQWRYGDESQPTAGVTFFAGTFVRHPFAIAAAHAALSYIKSAGPALQDGVNRKAARLAKTLNAFFAERGVKIFVAHFASQMFIRVSEDSELATLFFYHLRERGVHVLEGFPSYVTAAHSDADIDFVITAAKDSILEMQADGVLPLREGVAPARRTRSFEMTDGQREIWVTAQMGEAANCALSESDAIEIAGPLDAARFIAAAAASLAAQEAFRLRFSADGAAQSVDPDATFNVAPVDLSAMSDGERKAAFAAIVDREAATPFDLENGPLVRAHLVQFAPDRHVFLVYAHHIVFDGYSAELLVKDIAARYETGKGLDGLAPYSLYAAKAIAAPGRAAAQAYWRERLAAPPAPLDLPTDRPFPARRGFEGATARGRIDAATTAAIKAAARAGGVGVSATLLSAYAALMSRLTGQEDFVVGVPAAGQAGLGVETVGYCVNMLPMRLSPSFGTPFIAFAKQTQKLLVAAMEHQNLCLSDLARDLKAPRDTSRPALVQNVFNYSAYFGEMSLGEAKIRAAENPRAAVHHELFINLTEAGDGLAVDWDYASAIFDATTIARWISHLSALIADIARRPDAPIGELAIMSAVEREAVVVAMRRG